MTEPTPRYRLTLSPEAHSEVPGDEVEIHDGDITIVLPLNLELELFSILDLRSSRRKAAYNGERWGNE